MLFGNCALVDIVIREFDVNSDPAKPGVRHVYVLWKETRCWHNQWSRFLVKGFQWILERGLFWVGSRGEAGQQGGTEIDRLEMEGESTEQ